MGNTDVGVGPSDLFNNSGVAQPRAALAGTPTKCCDCNGSGNPSMFALFCGVPNNCCGPSYSADEPPCCECCGGNGSNGGSGGCSSGTLCDVSRGVGTDGSPPQPPSPDNFANDPIAFAVQSPRNVHGFSLSGQQGPAFGGGSAPAVNVGSGNVVFPMQPPTSGAFAPAAAFYKNTFASSETPPPSAFGNQVSGMWQDSGTDPITSCTYGYKCSGSSEHFDDAVPESPNFNWIGSSVTQPNGFTYDANPSNITPGVWVKLTQAQQRNGSRLTWTMINAHVPDAFQYGGPPPAKVVDPLGRILTFTYTELPGPPSVAYLRSVRDAGGRITTFTTQQPTTYTSTDEYNITSMMTPDRQSITMTYSGMTDHSQALTSLTTPDGRTWNYTYYDGMNAQVRSVTTPMGYITTYSYGLATAIKNPRGYVSTISGSRFTNPLGQIATTTFSGHLMGASDANGTATFTYWIAPIDSVQWKIHYLQSVRNQASGIFTYTYNYNYGANFVQLTGLTNQKGDRTTLVWDSDGFRTAVINAQLLRTSYSYNNSGQITAVTDPLLRRTTYVYDGFGERSAVINPAGLPIFATS
jgi:YD repeat-containing protein